MAEQVKNLLFSPQRIRAGEYENGAFDPASGFVFVDEGQSIYSEDHSRLDELELIAAAKDDIRNLKPESEETKVELAKKVLSSEALPTRLKEIFKRQPGGLHKVEVEYKDVSIEADAKVGNAQNPSMWNATKDMIGTFVPCAGSGLNQTMPMKLLDGVSGVIKPGRFTLLLGPPGSGKSIFLQTLSGRLKTHKGLRLSGSVKYNGEDIKDFVVQRTAGYVDQYDKHIPNLTVIETINFAAHCQIPEEVFVNALAGVKEQLSLIRRKKRRAEEKKAAGVVKEEVDQAMAELGSFRGSESFDTEGDVSTAMEDEEFLELFAKSLATKAKPYIILNLLGLGNVINTFVGDETLRGVSGGEKKRVTSAEVMVGPQWAIFMDEISTGLDSATTFSVVRSLRDACHAFERTVVVSLLQPPPEVMELFDDLLLLTDGKVIFHGPVHEAVPFFSTLGFDCPIRKDPGSFLQEVTSPVGQLTYANLDLLKNHGLSDEDRQFEKLMENPPKNLLVSVDEMKDAFWKTETGKGMTLQLEEYPFEKGRGNPHSLARTEYARSGLLLSWFAFKRQMLLIKRDKAYYIARSIQSVLMGLILASFFASVAPPNPPNPEDSFAQGRKVLSLCVFSIIYLSMSSMPVLGFVFNTKGVFYKHRDNKFFPSWAYAMAHLIAQVPSSTAESILFAVTVYWISGLTRTAGNFFIFLLVTWSCSNSLAGLFRLLAYVTPNMVRANALGSLILLLLMLTNGFTIVRTSIPDYMIWIYYGLNPLAYGVRALAINELTAPQWGQAGDQILSTFGIFTDRIWIWMGVLFNWVFLFGVTIVGAFSLRYLNPPPPKPSISIEDQKSQKYEGLGRYMRRIKLKKMLRSATKSLRIISSSKVGSSKREVLEKAAPVPFDPICLVCKDIKYYVNDPSGGTRPGVVKGSDDKEIEGKLQLLKGIDFYAEPGKLTALMGGSGAGKTTLMDVVAGRKTQGIIRGDILANGRQVEPRVWSRVVGYVEQLDVHSPCITVYETLHFAARLRLSEKTVSGEQVKSLVEETISTIELGDLRSLVVGNPGGEGLSIEQRKRLSIGVELVGNPSVLFMDEPTSGLDARAAAVVMRAVRNVASSNRTVTVTIHQPSQEIFEAFDMLVLLQRGGRLTYFGALGENSDSLISYLQTYKGVPSIKPGYNPATWMLEVTGGSMATAFKAADLDFPDEYAKSDLKEENLAKMDDLVKQTLESSAVLSVEGTYATSIFPTQAKMLLKKYFAYYWRAPHYNFTRIVMTIAIALIYGLVYLNEAKQIRPGSDPTDPSTIQNLLGLMFSLTIFNGMFNCMTVMPVIFGERTVYYRHRAASMYAPRALALAQGLAELPYLLAQSIIMVVIAYWMTGFQAVAWKFFYFLLMFFLSVTLYTFLGQCLVIACPNQLLAQLLAAFLNQMWTIFNGFLVPYGQTPAGWKWMARISPTTWVLYGLGATQLADSPVELIPPPANTTVGEYVQDFWGYDPGFAWWCILIVFAYIVFFRTITVLFLTYVSYNKR